MNVFILIPTFSHSGVSCSSSLWHVKIPSLQWSCSLSSYHASRFYKASSNQISLFQKRTRYVLRAGNNRTHEGRINVVTDTSVRSSTNSEFLRTTVDVISRSVFGQNKMHVCCGNSQIIDRDIRKWLTCPQKHILR